MERTETVERTVTFRSAYSGVVVAKGVTAGQRLMPGDVAYRIADLSRVLRFSGIFHSGGQSLVPASVYLLPYP